jgi:hypothetical protein
VRGLVGHQTWGLRGFLPRHGRERQARSGRPLPRCSDPLVMGLFGGEGHARRALRGRRIGGTAVSGKAEVELWKTPSRKTWARQPACQRPNFGPTVFGKSSDFDLYTSKRIRIRQVRTKWKKENLKRQSQSKKKPTSKASRLTWAGRSRDQTRWSPGKRPTTSLLISDSLDLGAPPQAGSTARRSPSGECHPWANGLAGYGAPLTGHCRQPHALSLLV